MWSLFQTVFCEERDVVFIVWIVGFMVITTGWLTVQSENQGIVDDGDTTCTVDLNSVDVNSGTFYVMSNFTSVVETD